MNTRMTLKAFVFDLGGVLLQSSASTTSSIPSRTLHSICESETWNDFESERISQQQCYIRAAEDVPFSPEEIHEAFAQARNSRQPNHELITAIKELKVACQGIVKIFAMSNISKEDYAYLAPKNKAWEIFDDVFTSGHAGMSKPDLSFYKNVLEQVELQSQQVFFMDDRLANVLAASCLGLRAFLFSENQLAVDIIHGIQNDPCEKGLRFLEQVVASGDLDSVTDTRVVVPDNFAKLLIQDTLPS